MKKGSWSCLVYEADVDDAVGSHATGLLLHALQGLLARLVQQLGIGLELAAHNVFQTRHEVTAGVLGAHGAALDQAQMPRDAVAG